MVLRIPSSLTSSNSRPSYIAMTASDEGPEAGAGAFSAGLAASLAGAVAGCLASSTSARTMRPCGPDPLIWRRSSPFSAAMRRARGEAKMRSPLSSLGAAGAGVSDLATGSADLPAPEPSPPCFSSFAGSAVSADFGALASVSISSALSPSSSSTAMGVLTLTPSVPSSIRILPMVPSSTASNSIVALSVSISARRSPALTVSPSLTSHLASVPSSMVGERAGMRISVGIASLSLPVGHLAHGVDHLGGRGQRQLFEIGRVGHRHVLAGAVDHRRVEIVERLLHQHRGDVAADGGGGPAFLDGDAAVGFHHRLDHRVGVHRAQGAQVHHLGLYAVFGQFFGGFQRVGHADAKADDGHVRPLAPDLGLAEGDGEIIHLGHLEGLAVEDLVFEKDHRVGVADRAFQQALGTGRRIGLHHAQAGDLGIPGGVVLTVLRADAGGGAVGATEDDGAAHLAA